MYYAKESVKVSEGQYWERAIRKSPFKTEDAAKKACDRSRRDDNQPFVATETGWITFIGPKGKDY